MVSPILWCGGEDLSLVGINSIISSGSGVPIYINSTSSSGQFRSGYARYSVNVAQTVANSNFYIRNAAAFSATTFWTSARFWTSGSQTNPASGWSWMRFLDANGVVRLRILTQSISGSILRVQKQNSVGTITQIGSDTASGVSTSPSTADKIDVYIDYQVAGTFRLYINRVLIFNYSGDVTTDSQTALAYVDFGLATGSAISTLAQDSHWSEEIVSTRDTRNMSVVTQMPWTEGNAHAWSEATGTSSQNNGGSTPSTTSTGANAVIYSKFTRTATANAGRVSTLTNTINAGVTGNTQMAVYSDNNGVPGSLLGSSAVVVNPLSGATTYTFTNGPTLMPGTVYWVAFWANVAYVENYNTAAASGVYTQTGQTGGFPATAGASAFDVDASTLWTMALITLRVQELFQTENPDFSVTNGQIQQYTNSQAFTASYGSVVAVVHQARCTVGATSPVQHIQFGVRMSGTDYFTTDLTPSSAWDLLTYIWEVNPATSLGWQFTDIPAASTSFNMGYKATT